MTKLVLLSKEKRRYIFGAGKGQWRGIERALARPLPDDLQTAFESGPFFPKS